jgi:PAS domain S-box-containing protein
MPHTQPNFVSSRHYVDVTERFINIGFWNADKGMSEVRGTEGFFRITGFSRSQPVTLQRWISILHPEDREDFRAIFSIVPMDVPVSREVRLIGPNRPFRWVRISVEQFTTTGHLVGLIQDLANERVASAALHRERARLDSFLDMTHAIFWAMDVTGSIVDLRGLEEITGRNQDDCQNGGWADLIHRDDRQRIVTAWSKCLRDGSPFEGRFRLRYGDDVYRAVLARCTPVRQKNGTPIEWIGCLQEMWRKEAADPLLDGKIILKPQQLRAARAMLGWSADKLASEAGVSPATIRRYETTDEHMKEATVSAILVVLNSHGIAVTASSEKITLSLDVKQSTTERARNGKN